jgi:hypothetical protein
VVIDRIFGCNSRRYSARPFSGATGWFNNSINVDVSVNAILANVAGLSHSINSVLWSVQIELAMIALLPLMVGICSRTSLAVDYGILCALGLVSIFARDRLWNSALFCVLFLPWRNVSDGLV